MKNEAECPCQWDDDDIYYCPLHAAAPQLLAALEGLKCWDCEYPLNQSDYAGCYSCKSARDAIEEAKK